MNKTKNMYYGVAVLLTVALAAVGTGCSKSNGSGSDMSSGGGSGQGGSMARFTIHDDYLYTVDDTNLKVVSLADPTEPIELKSLEIGWSIETIFTVDDRLFIGSQSAMYIYDISRPAFPERLSTTTHFRSCDPVVAYDTLAFVTLNTSIQTWCGAMGNLLQVYNIADVSNPKLIKEIQMTSPRGLAVDGDEGLLFVCDKGGVSAYEFEASATPGEIEMGGLYMSTELPEVKNIDAYDCIALDGKLLIIGSDGLYQLGYDREEFTFISKIDIR